MEKGEGLRVRKNGDGLRLEIRGRKKEGLRVGKRKGQGGREMIKDGKGWKWERG